MSAVLDAPHIESNATVLLPKPVSTSTRTTLFELISALQDAAGPDDDKTVVAVLADMFQAGRIRFLNDPAECH